MIRKTLIAVAAAATMALGVGASTAPAEAGVKVYIGTPYVGHYKYKKRYHRAPYHCHKRVTWKYGKKRVVKWCHRAWH